MLDFATDIIGRVKNLDFPKNKPLAPLFEAVSNSFHAIEERESESEGVVEITVLRSQLSILTDQESKSVPPITGFVISDNGVGLNEENFRSFMTLDSSHKAKLGGKGVGRLTYIAAFEDVKIESVFLDKVKNKRYTREFSFSLLNSGIDDEYAELQEEKNTGTKVFLKEYKDEYIKYLPTKKEDLQRKIIEHFLIKFINDKCPKVILKDGDDEINLNQVCLGMVEFNKEVEPVVVSEQRFALLHLKVDERLCKENKLVFLANEREVEKVKLKDLIVDLSGKIQAENKNFWYIGLISGKYLDQKVSSNRLQLNIPQKTSNDLIDEISIEKINQECVIKTENYLKGYLKEIRDNKSRTYQEKIDKKFPQYKHLEKYKSEEFAKLKPNLTDENLEDELHKLDRNLKKEISKDTKNIINKLTKTDNLPENYSEVVGKIAEKLADISGATLASYVVHRKAVIDILEKGLRRQEDGKFNCESYIHQIIYPMKRNSREIFYENHNLWLIDERLSFSSYISSDYPLKKNDDRVDIMLLDCPVAVSDAKNTGRYFDTLTIFELKRPKRDDYYGENPAEQMIRYLKKIKEGKAKDRDGNAIKISDTTRIHLYALCDITEKLKESLLLDQDFTETPDGMGLYKRHTNLNAMIEIISYNKIIEDAKMRNRVFFEKLGIDG